MLSPPIFFFFKRVFFFFLLKSTFRFTAKLRGRYRRCPIHPTHGQPPPLSTSPPDATLVTKDEPTSTSHGHPESVVYVRLHSWCCTSYGFDKCIRIYSHQYGIIQGIFTALKILRALPFYLHKPGHPVINVLSPSLCLVWNAISLESYSVSPFQVGFFHLVICV